MERGPGTVMGGHSWVKNRRNLAIAPASFDPVPPASPVPRNFFISDKPYSHLWDSQNHQCRYVGQDFYPHFTSKKIKARDEVIH